MHASWRRATRSWYTADLLANILRVNPEVREPTLLRRPALAPLWRCCPSLCVDSCVAPLAPPFAPLLTLVRPLCVLGRDARLHVINMSPGTLSLQQKVNPRRRRHRWRAPCSTPTADWSFVRALNLSVRVMGLAEQLVEEMESANRLKLLQTLLDALSRACRRQRCTMRS